MKNIVLIVCCIAFLACGQAEAATKAQCPEKALGTGTVEGIIAEKFCEDGFCFVTLTLPSGESFDFAASYEDMNMYEDKNRETWAVGQRVSVQYGERQFWHEGINKCVRPKDFMSGKVLAVALAQATQKAPAPVAQSTERPIRVNVKPGVREGLLISITSTVNEVIIQNVLANRGNTHLFDIANPLSLFGAPFQPRALKFGQTAQYGTLEPSIIELEVQTNLGSWRFAPK